MPHSGLMCLIPCRLPLALGEKRTLPTGSCGPDSGQSVPLALLRSATTAGQVPGVQACAPQPGGLEAFPELLGLGFRPHLHLHALSSFFLKSRAMYVPC